MSGSSFSPDGAIAACEAILEMQPGASIGVDRRQNKKALPIRWRQPTDREGHPLRITPAAGYSISSDSCGSCAAAARPATCSARVPPAPAGFCALALRAAEISPPLRPISAILARSMDTRSPPLRPASRASSGENSCALPFSCAARPPFRAISRCFSGSMDANPRFLVPDSICTSFQVHGPTLRRGNLPNTSAFTPPIPADPPPSPNCAAMVVPAVTYVRRDDSSVTGARRDLHPKTGHTPRKCGFWRTGGQDCLRCGSAGHG